jgi:hypothetical protein
VTFSQSFDAMNGLDSIILEPTGILIHIVNMLTRHSKKLNNVTPFKPLNVTTLNLKYKIVEMERILPIRGKQNMSLWKVHVWQQIYVW